MLKTLIPAGAALVLSVSAAFAASEIGTIVGIDRGNLTISLAGDAPVRHLSAMSLAQLSNLEVGQQVAVNYDFRRGEPVVLGIVPQSLSNSQMDHDSSNNK